MLVQKNDDDDDDDLRTYLLASIMPISAPTTSPVEPHSITAEGEEEEAAADETPSAKNPTSAPNIPVSKESEKMRIHKVLLIKSSLMMPVQPLRCREKKLVRY